MKISILLGITIPVIFGTCIVWNNANSVTDAADMNARKQPVPSKVIVSPKPTLAPTITPSPTLKPVYTAIPKLLPTATPIVYQNYGWYEHDGQSMQYLNGSWYAEPQQEKPKPPSSSTDSPSASSVSSTDYKKYCPDFLIGQTGDWCESCKKNGLDPNGCRSWYMREHG